MQKQTFCVSEETAELLGSKPNKSAFMRHVIEKALMQTKKKMEAEITIKFVNTGAYFNKELTVKTSTIGNLKDTLTPLLEAIQHLQDVITDLEA